MAKDGEMAKRIVEIRDSYAQIELEVPAPAKADPFLIGTIAGLIEDGIRRFGQELFE